MEDHSLAEANALIEVAERSANEILSTDEGWTEFQNSHEIRGLTILNDDDAGLRTVKVSCTVNRPAQQIVDFYCDISNKPLWDKTSAEIRIVKSFSDDFKILYEKIKVPWPVSNRDNVFVQKRIQTENGFLVVGKSINGLVPEVDGNVRADIICIFLKVNRVSDSVSEVIMGGRIDPKGSIPKMIINKMIKRQAGILSEFRKKLVI